MQIRSRLSFANVTSVLALSIALGGTSYAAVTVTGSNVRDGSLTGRDLRNGSVKGTDIANNSITSADIRRASIGGSDVADGSLVAKDFKAGALPAGTKGDPGTAGAKGDAGAAGAKGDVGPVGPKGDAGATGREGGTGPTGPEGATGPGFSGTVVRRAQQVFPGDQPIPPTTVTASCLPGETATGGSADAIFTSSGESVGGPFTTRDRPVPSEDGATPTGWQMSYTTGAQRLFNEAAIVVYVVCAR